MGNTHFIYTFLLLYFVYLITRPQDEYLFHYRIQQFHFQILVLVLWIVRNINVRNPVKGT